MDPINWLKQNQPHTTSVIDATWVFAQYKYPDYVQKYIRESWFEECYENKCNYYKYKQAVNQETVDGNSVENSKDLTCDLKKSKFYKSMDNINAKAVEVWENKGEKEAIEFMFTNPETKEPLSYAEMRSRFG